MRPPSNFQFEVIDNPCVLFRTGMNINYYNSLITYANDNDLWNQINDEVICNEQGWIKTLHDVCLMHFSVLE